MDETKSIESDGAMADKKSWAVFRLRGRALQIFGRTVTLPASRLARIAIGVLFVLGGCVSFLPILGVWMLPLGFLILSMDIAIVRRWRRRLEVRWRRWRAGRKAASEAAALSARQ